MENLVSPKIIIFNLAAVARPKKTNSVKGTKVLFAIFIKMVLLTFWGQKPIEKDILFNCMIIPYQECCLSII